MKSGRPTVALAKAGARGGNRTRTPLLKRDFKSLASTDFATRAGNERIRGVLEFPAETSRVRCIEPSNPLFLN